MSSKKVPPKNTPAPEITPETVQKELAQTRSALPRFLREKTPIWLYVATAGGAFINFLGFVFLISPHNRSQLLSPPVSELEELGLSASQIADRLSYADAISPMMLNAAAGVFLMCSISLIVAFRRKKVGIYAYIFLTFVMITITMAYGLFNPALLMVPTAVTVTAAMNKEFLH